MCGGFGAQAERASRERDGARSDAGRGAQQQQRLDGAFGGRSAFPLAQRQQAAFPGGRCVCRTGVSGRTVGRSGIRLFRLLGDRDFRQMHEVRRLGARVSEDGAAQGVAAESVQHLVPQGVEDGFAGVQPDAGSVGPGPAHAEVVTRGRRITVESRKQRIECGGPCRGQREVVVEIAADRQSEQLCGRLHEPAHVGRKQLQVPLAIEVAAQRVETLRHLARPAVEPRVGGFDAGDLPGGQRSVQPVADPPFAVVGQRFEQVVAERPVVDEPADDVEDLVGTQLPADRLQLVEQHLQHAALASAGGDEVDDHHVAPLAVAVDAPQALFQARGIPGNVVVDHQPAELQVDAFPGRVGGDEETGAVGVAEPLDRRFAFRPRHAAVNRDDPSRVPEALQAPDQVLDRVAVLAEDQPLVAGVALVVEHCTKPFELRLGPRLDQPARPRDQPVDGGDLFAQLVDRHGDHRAEDRLLVRRRARNGAVVVAGVGVSQRIEDIGVVSVAGRELRGAEIRCGEASGSQILDRAPEPRDSPFQRPAKRPRRAGEAPLEHAQGKAGRRLVVQRVTVRAAQPGRGEVVQRLLAVGARRQVVAERGAGALREERSAGQVDHLLLGPADEVAGARHSREAAERLFGAERVRVEQAPQLVVGRVLAHVRRGAQQQEMARAPAQAGETTFGSGAAGQRLGELVAAGLAGAPALPRGGQLVGLVEDRQIVGGHRGAPQPLEHGVAGQRVQRHDDQIAIRFRERVAGTRRAAGDDPESKPEQRPQLPLPVADQTGGRHDDHPLDPSPRQHLAHDEPGNDRLAGPRVVGQQEAERILTEHSLVDRDALVRQWIDARGLAGERRVALMAVGQMQRFGDGPDGIGAAGEVERWGHALRPGPGPDVRLDPVRRPRGGLFFQCAELRRRQWMRARLTVLPPVHRERRDAEPAGELLLGEVHGSPETSHVLGCVHNGCEVHRCPRVRIVQDKRLPEYP